MVKKQLTSSEKVKIIRLHDLKYSWEWIATKFGRSKSTIYNVVKKFQTTGNLDRKKGSGRRCCITKKQERYILQRAKRYPRSSFIELKRATGLKCSTQTISNRLKNNEFVSRFTVKNRSLVSKIDKPELNGLPSTKRRHQVFGIK